MSKTALVVLLALVGVLSATQDASAKIFIYNTGKEIFECGPLPEPYASAPEAAGYKAGYYCDIVGVFWSYFSVSNCKPVAFKGDTYNDDPEIAAAVKAKYPESSMKRGIWGKYGWMLLALLVVVGIGYWIKEKITGEDD